MFFPPFFSYSYFFLLNKNNRAKNDKNKYGKAEAPLQDASK